MKYGELISECRARRCGIVTRMEMRLYEFHQWGARGQIYEGTRRSFGGVLAGTVGCALSVAWVKLEAFRV